MNNSLLKIIFLFFIVYFSTIATAETTLRGLAQVQFIDGDDEASFLNRGTGLLRHDEQSKVELAHAFLDIKSDLTSNVKFNAVLNHTQSADPFTNFSQFFLSYKPIWSSKYRWQFRGGMFYPAFGFENPSMGWTSPFNYTNSAISSWIGEEMRIGGGEFKVTRPGRSHDASPHTFALVGSFFKGNDTTGTILAWRGWGLHDKQALFNESIPFAKYPSIGPGGEVQKQAAWVEPFREIDGRFGYYTGGHWDYQKKSRMRYYYYDNNADELILGRDGQYAWHTKFHSLSWQYRFDKSWRLVSHYMNGNTKMGAGIVNIDFNALYLMMSYKTGAHQISARIDKFETIDRDKINSIDDNNGNGSAFTASYRFSYNKNWQLGAEYLYGKSFQANRAQFTNLDTDINQHQLMGVVQFQF